MSNLIDADIIEVKKLENPHEVNELLGSGWKLIGLFVVQSAAPVEDGRCWYVIGRPRFS
jgi:hypothetical protein